MWDNKLNATQNLHGHDILAFSHDGVKHCNFDLKGSVRTMAIKAIDLTEMVAA
jgi:hypothetical protein